VQVCSLQCFMKNWRDPSYRLNQHESGAKAVQNQVTIGIPKRVIDYDVFRILLKLLPTEVSREE